MGALLRGIEEQTRKTCDQDEGGFVGLIPKSRIIYWLLHEGQAIDVRPDEGGFVGFIGNLFGSVGGEHGCFIKGRKGLVAGRAVATSTQAGAGTP